LVGQAGLEPATGRL